MARKILKKESRERSVPSLQRKLGKRSQNPRVLIVCEGSKTEPYYFRALQDELKLISVRICASDFGTDPMSVVRFALSEWDKDGYDRDYDRMYCVFDKDSHETYQEALKKINFENKQNKLPIYGVPSVPCFEYWILSACKGHQHAYRLSIETRKYPAHAANVPFLEWH